MRIVFLTALRRGCLRCCSACYLELAGGRGETLQRPTAGEGQLKR
mgnify:CR=1 FL=1